MSQLSPYIALKGKCREAMDFYQQALGGEVTIMTFGESPMKDQVPAEMQNNVVHAVLKRNGSDLLMGSDMSGPQGITDGNNITLCLNCENDEEINKLFNNLSDGANITSPLKKEFWGGTFGTLTDKYGVNWMFNCG